MTAYFNPPHGNDATAQMDSRALPFKTFEAAQDACNALPRGTPIRIVETHKTPPVEVAAVEADLLQLPVAAEDD